jgi:hypothetical protein
MVGIAAFASLLIVTLAVAYVVGRTDVGAGLSLATAEVAKSAPQYWNRPLPFPPAGEMPGLAATEPPARWTWSIDDLPPALRLATPQRNAPTWEVWSGN